MNYDVKVSTNKVEKTQSVKMYYYGNKISGALP